MKAPQKNLLEWTVFALGCVMVLGVVGFLAAHAWGDAATPSKIEIELGRAEERQGYFAVPVTIFNRGGESAEQVAIEVVLPANATAKEETASLQIAFLPRQSSRDGWVAFTRDPGQSPPMTARPLGYETP